MVVREWHAGQLAVFWLCMLLVAGLLIGSCAVWKRRCQNRVGSYREMWEPAGNLPALESRARRTAATIDFSQLLLSDIEHQLLREAESNRNQRRIMRPLVLMLVLGLASVALSVSWQWFGARRA